MGRRRTPGHWPKRCSVALIRRRRRGHDDENARARGGDRRRHRRLQRAVPPDPHGLDRRRRARSSPRSARRARGAGCAARARAAADRRRAPWWPRPSPESPPRTLAATWRAATVGKTTGRTQMNAPSGASRDPTVQVLRLLLAHRQGSCRAIREMGLDRAERRPGLLDVLRHANWSGRLAAGPPCARRPCSAPGHRGSCIAAGRRTWRP
jgi:hypothetical protein